MQQKTNIKEKVQDKTRDKDFELFFMDMYPRLMRYATSLLGDGVAAHDIVSEMFERAWSKRLPVSRGEQLNNWAYMAVHHACLNRLKHLKVEHDNQRELAASMLYDNTIDYRHHERMLHVVEQTIEHMGEPTRTILRLCALKRNTYRQTADIMGISVHTVKKHMSKAYDMLRRTLNDKYSSEEIEKGL